MVELTRKRQGQNIYELFGKKCSSCNGIGHVENQMNYAINNLQIKNIDKKPNSSNSLKPLDIDTSQSADKQGNIIEKEFLNPKNLNKDDSSNKKENENDNLNTLNSKEKNTIKVDLTNDEKIVFSQLGINPLIKLGKEYLTSNNFVHLTDNSKGNEKPLDNKKTTTKEVKKISESIEANESKINRDANANSKNESQKANENEEVAFLEKKDEIELSDEINNARKKRRRSSAIIE